MNLRTWQALYNSLIALGIVMLVVAILINERHVVIMIVLGIGGLVIAIAGFILQLIFWKCPHCDKHLPTTGTFGMIRCPYCGNDLFK
ncbi:hypothetical protein [Bifidobacterium biavatii]|uniref:Uncharacterized protein n=1 Tax=Bifidobacterium biavatii DSM 23969 TaxID=1437608 RepID=A0A087A0H4_9BIFI|nr:hypothetical protein [Bifidobacterium biavatii]KFI52274.1 hypothetical protein BBIA_0572 [Bifidobacterium biavatii DSM 23969]